MRDKPVKKNIEDYLVSAKKLEETRCGIDSSLRQSLVEDIIPTVEGQLPKGYQIDHEKSSIGYISPGRVRGVPTYIVVDLRLKHGGQPLHYSNQNERELIESAREALESTLNGLSDSYGVAVQVSGEPVRIL